jgi:hypothetical protein
MIVSKSTTIGVSRNISNTYAEIKRQINNKKVSLNDSGNTLNDQGKAT